MGASESPVENIRGVLKSQVVDILCGHLPQLAQVPRPAAYDHILDSPPLLHDCFQLFRRRPELFAPVAITPERRPVARDEDQLWCGRTVSEVVAMIVRSAAIRYFRARLDPPPPTVVQAQSGWLSRTLKRGDSEATRPATPLATPGGKAEKLYQALRDMLLFDWQAPLIPHYAPLTPRMVTLLGSRLLKLREPELKMLVDEGMPEGRLPVLLDGAKRILAPDATINAEVLWLVIDRTKAAELYPGMDIVAVRRSVAHIATIDRKALAALMPALGDDLKRLCLFLFVAYHSLGTARFRQVFGQDGQGWVVAGIAERLAARARWPVEPEGIRRATEEALAAAVDGGMARA